MYIASLSSSSSIGSLSDVKFVSTKVSLVRLKDEKCETSPLSVVFRYHLLSLIASGLTPAWSGVSVNLSGFITSSLKSRSTLCLKKNQRLIKVVFKAPSLFSRILRPTIDSAETRGSWRPHCHNTGRKGKWDTEKNGYFDNAHVQCNHLREWINAWVCECIRYFRSILTLRIHGISRKHYMGWSCSWSWWKKEKFDAFRKKTFSPLCAWFFWNHVDENALCYMRVLKFGRTSTSNKLTVFTAVIKLSAFVDDFVKQSAKQLRVEMRARSWILPERFSFRNMEIMWIVSFCSGKGIVLAVVTRFFASVLMWISATSHDMSIHNPRKNWHETKHFMNEYNSVTVVESTVLNLLTIVVRNTTIWNSILRGMLS